MWITNHKTYIDLEIVVIFHNRVNDNIISNVLLAHVKVNFVVTIC